MYGPRRSSSLGTWSGSTGKTIQGSSRCERTYFFCFLAVVSREIESSVLSRTPIQLLQMPPFLPISRVKTGQRVHDDPLVTEMSPRIEGGSPAACSRAAWGIAFGGVGPDGPLKMYPVRQSCPYQITKNLPFSFAKGVLAILWSHPRIKEGQYGSGQVPKGLTV